MSAVVLVGCLLRIFAGKYVHCTFLLARVFDVWGASPDEDRNAGGHDGGDDGVEGCYCEAFKRKSMRDISLSIINHPWGFLGFT
jgi:hypothetical protein